jgi:hypothetical protein
MSYEISLAQKLNRITALEATTKLSYEALHPQLSQTAVGAAGILISIVIVTLK